MNSEKHSILEEMDLEAMDMEEFFLSHTDTQRAN